MLDIKGVREQGPVEQGLRREFSSIVVVSEQSESKVQ